MTMTFGAAGLGGSAEPARGRTQQAKKPMKPAKQRSVILERSAIAGRLIRHARVHLTGSFSRDLIALVFTGASAFSQLKENT
jgi:hypothetical protein